MKAILISIKPKWVKEILNGNKTIEIRKRFPKDYVGWVYIYCTKDKKYANLINRGGFLTGMVVARFWCDKVEEHKVRAGEPYPYLVSCIKACLTNDELEDYGFVEGKGYVPLYAIHITKLEIFDKPKEISGFKHDCYHHYTMVGYTSLDPLTRAPQSWCYVEVLL